jgi:hypothetical protein
VSLQLSLTQLIVRSVTYLSELVQASSLLKFGTINCTSCYLLVGTGSGVVAAKFNTIDCTKCYLLVGTGSGFAVAKIWHN